MESDVWLSHEEQSLATLEFSQTSESDCHLLLSLAKEYCPEFGEAKE